MTRSTLILTAFAAAALLAVGGARAATPDQLPGLGYHVTETILKDGCHGWATAGYGVSADFGSDCADGFQASLDAFVAGHPERKLGYEHLDAVAARASLSAKGYAVATDYVGPSFHVTGGCGVDATADPAGFVALDGSLPAAAPCPAPPTTTDAPTTSTPPSPVPPGPGDPPPTDPAPAPAPVDPAITDLQAQIAELRAALASLATRVSSIEAYLAAGGFVTDTVSSALVAQQTAAPAPF